MKRPRATLTDSIKNTNKQYGTPATAAIINHQTDLIADFVNDYCHTIWFDEMLDELNRYTDENKRKFDIIAACGMAELADEELSGVVPNQVEQVRQNTWQNIGYYKDSRGITHWGVLPQSNFGNVLANDNFNDYDEGGIRTSNPNKYYGYF